MNLRGNADSANHYSPAAVVGYGILTAVFLIAFLIVTGLLNRQPRFVPSDDTRLPPGWSVFTDADRDITFNLPPRWQQFDRKTAVSAAALQAELEKTRRYRQALHLFRRVDPDNQILFLALPPTSDDAFLLVAQNPRLRPLPLDRFVSTVRAQEELSVLEIETVPQIGAGQQIRLFINVTAARQQWRCLQHFVPGANTGYIMAGCAVSDRYSLYDDEIESALASFQVLAR